MTRKLGLEYYILDEQRRVVPGKTLLEWGMWWETANRIVGQTRFDPDILVSTVFLGIDHRLWGDGPPLLFETMVFGISMDDEAWQWRYSSWDDAETGHKATVRKVHELLVKSSRAMTRKEPT